MKTEVEHCRHFDVTCMTPRETCPKGYFESDDTDLFGENKAIKCMFGDCEYYED